MTPVRGYFEEYLALQPVAHRSMGPLVHALSGPVIIRANGIYIESVQKDIYHVPAGVNRRNGVGLLIPYWNCQGLLLIPAGTGLRWPDGARAGFP